MTALRFYVQAAAGRIVGPLTDDEVREAVQSGTYSDGVPVRSGAGMLWLPARAWAALALPAGALAAAPADQAPGSISPDLLLAPGEVLDMVRFAVLEHGQVFGPLPGKVLRDGFGGGRYNKALVAPHGTQDWVAASKLFDRTLDDHARAVALESAPDLKRVRCRVCREHIPESATICPECDEPVGVPSAAASSRSSVTDEVEGASWLRMHWRPLLTFGAIMGLIMAGITLRFLAPGRFAPNARPAAMAEPTPPAQTCDADCWTGEACQLGECVWQKPNSVGHVEARPGVAGPFALPPDVADAILLDRDRFAIGLLSGTEVRSTRTGQSLGLVSEASQTRQLLRVEGAVYAIGPQHIAVLDESDLRLKKTIELGAIVSHVEVGANGRRALVSLPGAHAVAILSTELHVELDRIRFGDDAIGPLAVDDMGKRAMTTTGLVPVLGLPDKQGGAVYAFDPNRLATEQDRVRAGMLGNPTSVLMVPNGKTAFVALRHVGKLRPVEWTNAGAIRLLDPIDTCDQPEELALLRSGRRGVIRCHRGRTIQVFDLETGATIRSIELNAPVSDMVVTPDGEQIVVALPSAQGGAVALIDATSFTVEMIPLTEPPTRVRLSPSGDAILALSDRSKVAWVIR
ncbi:MAG: hypothetical protein IPM79_19710 [Polyangiaceae bacterium]|nr:hypothetical protein [Polyangiaceae bacterium]MBK8939780.1 hypothetical protein [Polyangiaceae bacterium]